MEKQCSVVVVDDQYKNRIDLVMNAKALGVVVHEYDRTENKPQKGGRKS